MIKAKQSPYGESKYGIVQDCRSPQIPNNHGCDRLLYKEVKSTSTKEERGGIYEESLSNSGHSNPLMLSKKHQELRKSFLCWRNVSGVLIVAILCLSLTFSIVIWQITKKSHVQTLEKNHSPQHINENSVGKNSSVCLSPDCVTASAAILQSMDFSVDPCEDFYGFVCNGWIERHSIPRSQSSWSVTDQRSEDNLEILRSILEKPLNYRSSKAEQKAQLLYRSCLDSDNRLETLGAKPLIDLIAETGGWNLSQSQNFNSSNFSLREKLIKIQKFNTNSLFHWYIREGMSNTSQYELFIHQGGLTLPSRAFYKNNHKAKPALFKFISSVVELSGGDKASHVQEIQAMIDFEEALAKIRDDRIAGMYVPLNRISGIIPLTPGFGNWTDFFNQIIDELFHKERKKKEKKMYLDGDMKVWVQYTYLMKLEMIINPFDMKLLESLKLHRGDLDLDAKYLDKEKVLNINNTINNYLTWRAMQPYLSFLSKDFKNAEKKFLKSMKGTQGREDTWKFCVINTNAAMGFAVAPAFVKSAFSEQSRLKAYEMIAEIKEAFKERMDSLSWINQNTAELIKQKINKTSELFGYPDFILDNKRLDEGYEDLKVSEREFFKNQVRFYQYTIRKNLDLLRQKVDRFSWPLNFPPSTVNAFYMYSRNQILFPAGVLQPPLFSAKQPMSLNFGHIGTFMGHEILHGLDDTGRRYGPNGQKETWWPNSTSETFETKTECFIKQYSQEIFGDRSVNGQRTLSENIADNGGLLASYNAYKSWYKKRIKEDQNGEDLGLLPGLPFSHEQLVFLGFARAHCSSTREKAMDLYLLTDRHSPSHVRVNTAVGNLEEFSNAWNCPLDANLRFEESKRCSLW